MLNSNMTSHKPLRVLIVEDDKTSRIVLRRILQTMDDLEIHEAEDGVRAWEMLDGGLVPQLCFLDLNMPRMNGLELLKRIRGDKRFPSIRACFCSAVRDRYFVEKAAALQPDNYILKPYTRDAIQTQVQKVLGTVRPEENLEPSEAVCARLGIDLETYRRRLSAFVEDVRTLITKLPTLFMKLDVEGEFSASKFSTFDRQAFLESMNVFGDPIAQCPDPGRAAQEIQHLEAVAASPVSLVEKCRLIWGIMKGQPESSVSLPGQGSIEPQIESSPGRGGHSRPPRFQSQSAGVIPSPPRNAAVHAGLAAEVPREAGR